MPRDRRLALLDAQAIQVSPDFQGTVYWPPALLTGTGGTAEVRFPWPHDHPVLRVRAVAVAEDGRIGQTDAVFPANASCS